MKNKMITHTWRGLNNRGMYVDFKIPTTGLPVQGSPSAKDVAEPDR